MVYPPSHSDFWPWEGKIIYSKLYIDFIEAYKEQSPGWGFIARFKKKKKPPICSVHNWTYKVSSTMDLYFVSPSSSHHNNTNFLLYVLWHLLQIRYDMLRLIWSSAHFSWLHCVHPSAATENTQSCSPVPLRTLHLAFSSLLNASFPQTCGNLTNFETSFVQIWLKVDSSFQGSDHWRDNLRTGYVPSFLFFKKQAKTPHISEEVF